MISDTCGTVLKFFEQAITPNQEKIADPIASLAMVEPGVDNFGKSIARYKQKLLRFDDFAPI